MKVAISGSHGFIGSALSTRLAERGDEVYRLVRRVPAQPFEIEWHPERGDVPDAVSDELASVDVVVHLAGAGLGDRRWNSAYKAEIRNSRVQGTAAIAGALARYAREGRGPTVLLSGSAIGYYGDRGDEELTEASEPGTGFLADVVIDWEAKTSVASAAGVRVACLRTGLVVSPDGGAFERLVRIFRLGAGGRLGDGRQWWSTISLLDHLRAVEFLLDNGSVSGPVNLVGPQPRRNAEVTREIAEAVHRPAALPVPGFALRAVMGEFSADVLASQRVLPAVLERSGFSWQQPTVLEALRSSD